MQQYTAHKWILVIWVYIYIQQTTKICVKDGFYYITSLRSCNATNQHGFIIFRKANTLYCAAGKIRLDFQYAHTVWEWRHLQHVLMPNYHWYVPDTAGHNRQHPGDNPPHKSLCASPSCNRREPRAISTWGSPTSRDCPAGRRQIPSRDTSPNHRHGFF